MKCIEFKNVCENCFIFNIFFLSTSAGELKNCRGPVVAHEPQLATAGLNYVYSFLRIFSCTTGFDLKKKSPPVVPLTSSKFE